MDKNISFYHSINCIMEYKKIKHEITTKFQDKLVKVERHR